MEPASPFPSGVSRRVRVAQGLAFVAIVAALLGALGPTDHVRTSYSWPPATLPRGTPARAWYTPLLLARHRPDAISARIPCSLPPALPAAAMPVTVLATARDPERYDALAVKRLGERLVVGIGDEIIARVHLPAVAAASRDCSYRLLLGNGRWALEGGPAEIDLDGALRSLPTVSGLFSELDLRSRPSPRIEVTTAVHAAQPTGRQTIAWTISALAVALALLLVAVEGRSRRPWTVGAALVRAGVGHARPVDAVVGVVLLAWWLISPANFDDGWLIARERMFASASGFSAYYSTFGTNLPLDYWLEWVQHWLVESSSQLVLLRSPALLCLAATWVLTRWVFARATAGTESMGAGVLWALACAFLLGALAWGMTLRPEPVTALLVASVMASAVRFRDRENAASVAAGAILVPLALTAHPAGVVALAPVLVVGPGLIRWARRHVAVAVTVVASATALLLTLAFVGSDLEQRQLDARITRMFAQPQWNELLRYTYLSEEPFGVPLRRGAVALLLLAVLSFLVHQRRRGLELLDLPGAMLTASLLLLVATPSKWPSHFGTLVGVGAVAVAVETARLRHEGSRSAGWRAWPFVVIGATTLAASWSWWTRTAWNALDLRTLDWDTGIAWRIPLMQLAIALPLVLLASTLLLAFARGDPGSLQTVPWRIAAWMAPALAIPLIAFTVGVLIADTVKTSSWTFGRQNIEALTGDPGCGLADDIVLHSSVRLAPKMDRIGSRSLVYPEVLPYFPCADLPALHDGIVDVPDRIVISTPNPVPPLRYNVTSPFLGLLDLYEIERIPVADTMPRLERLQVYDVNRRIPGAELVPPIVRRTSQ